MSSPNLTSRLIGKGVIIIAPETVHLSEDLNPDLIAGDGVVIHPGCRISGSDTVIMRGSQIGNESPVTLNNCQLGPRCRIGGGFFDHVVFAGDNTIGSGAHFRKGCILEEKASVAHTVGLKQTILFPFVTLGSLINFCDCLMAGGTGKKNHSEVGSSFIHFNFTPNQDKATASLIGTVSEGVMLDQPPVFLGGQGGLVGPCRLAFGCTTAAGSIVRKDELRPNRLIFGGAFKEMSVPFQSGVYRHVTRIFNNNVHYIAALCALHAWYDNVRSLFATDARSKALLTGMTKNLDFCITERLRHLAVFTEKLDQARQPKRLTASQAASPSATADPDWIIEQFRQINTLVTDANYSKKHQDVKEDITLLIKGIRAAISAQGADYVSAIQSLTPAAKAAGTRWLKKIEAPLINVTT